MKTVVVYDSVFGNTEKIALAVGEGASAKVVKVDALQPSDLEGVELLLVGSPTRGFRATEPIQKLLKGLPKNGLKGVAVGGFDTRMDVKEVKNAFLTFMESIFGYAAEPIAKSLVKCGGSQAVPPAGFFVHGSEGPLWDGELERAKQWGAEALRNAG
jgi:flavodoxin